MKNTTKSILTAGCLIIHYQLSIIHSFAQSRDVPFTLEDRDRIMQTQADITSLRSDMNTHFESQQQQTESLRNEMSTRFESLRNEMNLFYWGFGIMITLMITLFGYLVWERRTETEPVRDKTQGLVYSLREYANEQPKLADILRAHGLM